MKKLLLTFLGGVLCSLGMMAGTYSVSFNGKDFQSTADYFTMSGNHNFNQKYQGTYDGTTYGKGLKMESSSIISFTTPGKATLTIVQSLTSNTTGYPKVSTSSTLVFTGSASNRVDNSTDKVGVYTIELEAGTHQITRTGEYGILFASVTDADASKVAKPTITPTWGATYGSETTVSITCSTNGATIYYTTDGSTPTISSATYSTSFTVNADCTVKSLAVKNGLSNSEVASQNVTINNLRNIAFDFSGVTLTQGSAIANTTSANNVAYKLPNGRMYFVEGQTQTGWNDGANDYALGGSVTTDKDYTFAPVFEENQVALGDAEATVDWTFATANGAPSAGIEGNIGYYAAQTTVNGKKLDVVMTINATQDAAFPETRGKWNTTSASSRAQVNKGTIFTIPAISGMVVTYTATNGTPKTTSATFAGEEGTVDGMNINYTYNGAAATINIIDFGDNLYPSGIKVVYPAAQTGEDSDLALASATANVNKDKTTTVVYTSSSTGAVTASSSKTSVATAAVEGNNIVITGVAAGTATITVSQASDVTYKAGEKTITVTVTDPTAPVASFTAKATANGSIAEGAEDASIASYATIKGGSMTVFNGQTIAKDLVTTGGFSITYNNTYFKVTLNKPLMAGDKISTDVTEHKDIKGLGLWFTTTQGRPSTAPASATSVTTGTDSNQKITENLTYTVAEEDGICGETTFYVYRAAGKTTYFQNFTITTAATIAEATLNAKGYSTFSAAYPVKISGAKAYKATINAEGDKLVCTEIENGLVPAGEGVLLFGEAGAAVTAYYNASAPVVSDNELKATTLADGSLAAKVDALVLSGNTFLPYNGAAFAANKAYLPMPAGAKGGFSIVFDEDNTTAAAGVAEAKAEVKTVKLMTKDGLLIKNANGIVNAAGAQVK